MQATLVALTVPALAQTRAALSLEDLTFSTVYSSTIRAAANAAVGDLWTPEYEIEFDPSNVFTETLVVGRPARELELLDVRASAGVVELGSQHYTVTMTAADTREPLIIVPVLRPRAAGLHTQRIDVIFPGFTPSPYTDTLLAQPPPIDVQLHRQYPGRVRLGSVVTESYQIGPLTVLTETLSSGVIRNGVYEGVVTDQGRCAVGATAFRCALGTLGPGLPPAHITLTAMALEVGRVDQLFRAGTRGQTVTVPTQTMVELSPAFVVDITTPPAAASSRVPGMFPVAILSSAYLDAPSQVDRESLAFGPSGTERSALFCQSEDVNRDRRADLVCRFDAAIAGFRAGDSTGVLTGQTFSGVPIRGTAAVMVSAP